MIITPYSPQPNVAEKAITLINKLRSEWMNSKVLSLLKVETIVDVIDITDLIVDLEVEMRFGGDENGGDSRFFDFLGSKGKFLLA